MKSLEDSLREFQEAIANGFKCDCAPEYYASIGLYNLNQSEINIRRYTLHPSERNKKYAIAKLYHCVKSLGQSAVVAGVDIPLPKHHDGKMEELLLLFWRGNQNPFLEHTFFHLETCLFFTPSWTLHKLLDSSTKLILKNQRK